MYDDKRFDEALLGQLKLALAQAHDSRGLKYSPRDLEKLLRGNQLGQFLDVLHGGAKVVPVLTGDHYLDLMSSKEELKLEAIDGRGSLSEAQQVFEHIDGNVALWGKKRKSRATDQLSILIYELVKDGTLVQLVKSLRVDPTKLRFTQAQIILFATKYRQLMVPDGRATYMLFRANETLHAADLHAYQKNRLRLSIFPFKSKLVWDAKSRHRLVVPQLV